MSNPSDDRLHRCIVHSIDLTHRYVSFDLVAVVSRWPIGLQSRGDSELRDYREEMMQISASVR